MFDGIYTLYISGLYKRIYILYIRLYKRVYIQYTGCSEKKYNAQNRYSIQTNDDTGMKQRPIDR